MATRGRIGILLDDGTIRSVYSHWDNYPDGNGKILTERFDTQKKVEDLIDGGDISCLETDSDWGGNRRDEVFTLFYKDRGDIDCGALVSESTSDFFTLTRNCDGEYAYLFDPNTASWSCFDMSSAVQIPIPTGYK